MGEDAKHRLTEALQRAMSDLERHRKKAIAKTDLARQIHRSVPSVYAYMSGRSVPPIDVFEDLLVALDVTGQERIDLYGLHEEAQRTRRDDPVAAAARATKSKEQVMTARQLPALTAGFVGRAGELQRLNDILAGQNADAGTGLVVTITGTAGIGKTSLALAWTHQVAQRFPDGQLYLDLRGFHPTGEPATPAEALRYFLESCGSQAAASVTDDRLAADYRSVLADRRMLILLDNARDEEQVRPLLPANGHCLTVITSRRRLAGLITRERARSLVLDVLSHRDATALITECVGADRVADDPSAAAELVDQCGRHALALAVTATRATLNPRLSLRDLAAELHDERTRLAALSTDTHADDIRMVFSWSYHQLTELAAYLFRLLSLHPGLDVTTPVAAAIGGVPFHDARRAIVELVHAHLLAEHVPGRFACHDLLRAYAAELVWSADPDQITAASRRMLAWYLHTADAAGRVLNPDRRRRPLRVDPHPGPELRFADAGAALQWYECERTNLVAVTALAAEHGADDVAWQLPLAMVDFFDRRKYWVDWIKANMVALRAADRTGDPFARSTTHNSLGVAWSELGKMREALHHYELALELVDETGDLYSKAMLLTNVGNIRVQLGQYESGIDFNHLALALFREIENQYGQGLALENLGNAYARAGRLDEATGYLERSLAVCRQIGDKIGEAAVLDSLGETLEMAGQDSAAANCFQEALPIRRDVGDKFGEMITLIHLGDVLHRTNGSCEAHERWEDATQIAEELMDGPRLQDLRAKALSCACPQ